LDIPSYDDVTVIDNHVFLLFIPIIMFTFLNMTH